MLKLLALFAPLALACTASYADNCDTLRQQIEGKIKAAGVASFSVVVVDSAANVPGKIVGNCGKGARKIMYSQGGAATGAAPAKKTAEPILTECKYGTVSVGGSCKK